MAISSKNNDINYFKELPFLMYISKNQEIKTLKKY